MKRKISVIPLLMLCLVGFIASCAKRVTVSHTIALPDNEDSHFFAHYRAMNFDSTKSIREWLREAIAENPNESVYHHLLSREFAELGEMDSARAAAEQAIALEEENLYYWQNYHRLLLATRGKQSEVIGASKRCTELDENNPLNWYMLALDYYRFNMSDSALSICQQHYQQLMPIVPIDILIASIYAQKGNCDSAMQQTHILLASNPESGESNFFAAQTAMYCKQDSLAKVYFNHGLSLSCPDHDFLIEYLDFLCMYNEGEEAVNALRKSTKQCDIPSKTVGRAINLFLYSVKKDILARAETIEFFNQIFANFPHDNDLRISQFRYYNHINALDLAHEMMVELSEQDEQNYLWWVLRLRSEQAVLQKDTSADWAKRTFTLRRMTFLFPFDIGPVFQYAEETLKETGDYTRQLDTVAMIINAYERQLKRVKPQEIFTYKLQDSIVQEVNKQRAYRDNLSILHTYCADILVKYERFEDGWNAYESALKYNKYNSVALNNYAYYISLYNTNRLAFARKLSEQSLILDPNNVNYLDTYGYILYKLGELEEAKRVFIKMFSRTANPGRTALLHYSDLLEAMGNKTAAELYRMKAEDAKDEGENE